MNAHPGNGSAGDNVVPFQQARGFARPAHAAAPAAPRPTSARAKVDEFEDSANDRLGSGVTFVLFLLFAAFDAWLLLAAVGVRIF